MQDFASNTVGMPSMQKQASEISVEQLEQHISFTCIVFRIGNPPPSFPLPPPSRYVPKSVKRTKKA